MQILKTHSLKFQMKSFKAKPVDLWKLCKNVLQVGILLSKILSFFSIIFNNRKILEMKAIPNGNNKKPPIVAWRAIKGNLMINPLTHFEIHRANILRVYVLCMLNRWKTVLYRSLVLCHCNYVLRHHICFLMRCDNLLCWTFDRWNLLKSKIICWSMLLLSTGKFEMIVVSK